MNCISLYNVILNCKNKVRYQTAENYLPNLTFKFASELAYPSATDIRHNI